MAESDAGQLSAEESAEASKTADIPDDAPVSLAIVSASRGGGDVAPEPAVADAARTGTGSPYADREPAWLARLAIAVSALAPLAVVVATQSQLSQYAAGGGGAAEVAAPPYPVAISLVGSLLVALILSNRELRMLALRLRRDGPRATLRSLFTTINPLPELRHAWHACKVSLAAGGVALRQRLATRHTPPTLAAPPVYPPYARLGRQDVRRIGLLAALLLSLMADVGAAYLVLRPIAQWFWLGSTALLIIVAWGWTSPPTPLLRGEGSQRRARQVDAPSDDSWLAMGRSGAERRAAVGVGDARPFAPGVPYGARRWDAQVTQREVRDERAEPPSPVGPSPQPVGRGGMPRANSGIWRGTSVPVPSVLRPFRAESGPPHHNAESGPPYGKAETGAPNTHAVRRALMPAIPIAILLDLILLAILTIGALALRLPNLTELPYVVHGDEAQCGLEALRWLHGQAPSLLSVGWFGLPVAGYGLPALVMLVAGPTLFGLRLSSVILGTLSILLLYALAREFSSRRVAFLAAALLCVSHIHIHFSRMGIHNIHAVFAVTLTLWLFARALRTKSAFWAALTGASLSFSLQVYWGARIVFVIVPVVIVGLWLLRRSALVGRAQTLGWMLLSFVVAVGPLAAYFLSDQDALKSRTEQVLITTSDLWAHQHVISLFGTTNMQAILLRQFATIPLIPGALADQSLQYGPRFPLFDALLASLTLVGFWYAVMHLRQPLYLLLAIWVAGVALGGGALTIDMPWWPRLIVMVPALCLLAALMVNAFARLLLRAINGLALEIGLWAHNCRSLVWQELLGQSAPMLGARAALLAWLLALAVLGYSGVWSGYHYFVEYPRELTQAYRTQYTDIARYERRLPTGAHVILYSDPYVLWGYSTLQFLAPSVPGERAGSPQQLQNAIRAEQKQQRTAPLVIVITISELGSFTALRAQPGALPPGVYQTRLGDQGQVAFYTYTIT